MLVGRECGGEVLVGRECGGEVLVGRECGGEVLVGHECGGVVGEEQEDKTHADEGEQSVSIQQKGVVEGTEVNDVVLNTGCARTLIHRRLVPDGKKIPGKATTLRCAHGDTVLYPLANVELQVEGIPLHIKAAISDTLPVSVLLGTDVPELGQLLRTNPHTIHTVGADEALVVTRAKARELEQTRLEQLQKEIECGVQPTSLSPEHQPSSPEPDESVMGSTFQHDIFTHHHSRTHLTRRVKRTIRHKHGLVRGKDQRRPQRVDLEPPLSRDDLLRTQNEDDSLQAIREPAEKPLQLRQPFIREPDGLLSRQWTPRYRSSGEAASIKQLVLPCDCREQVLKLAHSVPLAGHLGRKKTLARISQRFYWTKM